MKSPTVLKRIWLLLLVLDLIFFPAAAFAGANIPGFYGSAGNLVQPSANQLPVIQDIVKGVSGLERVGANKLIVHQNKDKAVLDWQTFDIGANAWTHFDQQGNTDWSALNRIYDQNPSQIFGRLTADGSVYLINQNGMLFSQGSAVDVHGLVASSLTIATDDFLNGLRSFASENYQHAEDYDTSAVAVSNHGIINTDNAGLVMLIGPTVENSGTINAPQGSIILASGTDVNVTADVSSSEYIWNVDIGGESQVAANYETGEMAADLGYVGMFGRVVNQDGVIRAVTAVRKNGKIELQATETLTLGACSETASPISESDETLVTNATSIGGNIFLSSGGLIELAGSAVAADDSGSQTVEPSGARIIAPSGQVTVNAGNRVYLDDLSRIDVSGSWAVMPAEAAVASAQLNSVQLKDDQSQKESILRGQTIYYNLVEGSGIGDVSGVLDAAEKTARELSTTGGIIDITANSGDVIARSGATIDFSGGGIVYEGGFADTTVLISGNQAYRIETAPGNLTYDALIGPGSPVTDTNDRFGMSNAYDGAYHVGSASAVHNFCTSYHEGADAGWLNVVAPMVVLNAALDGSVLPGIHQTEDQEETYAYDDTKSTTRGTKTPDAGRLLIGGQYSGGYWQDRDPVTERIRIASEMLQLGDDFNSASALSESLAESSDGVSILSAEILNQAGLREIVLSVREDIVVEPDAVIALQPTSSINSSLIMAGRHIEHYGTITVPEGDVQFILSNNITSLETSPEYIGAAELGYERIYLADGSLVDVSGEHLDLSAIARLDGVTTDPGQIDGGTVILEDWTVKGEGVLVMPGAGIDVSGGWRIEESGAVTGGNAGTIQIAGSLILLEGDLCAHSLADANGGTLNLHAQQVTVATERAGSALPSGFSASGALPEGLDNHLIVTPELIDRTGAATIKLGSVLDLTVENDVTLLPSTVKSEEPGIGAQDTNGDVANFSAAEAAVDAVGEGFMRVAIDELHGTEISLSAGKLFSAEYSEYILPDELSAPNASAAARIASESAVAVAPGGKIGISGPKVAIAGQVTAPAGDIKLSATSGLSDMALTIQSGARVSAAAYHPPAEQLSATGLAVGYEPLDGGTITLSAARDLIVEADATLDVSGSEPVSRLLLDTDGTYRTETVTGSPGSMSINFFDTFQLDGTLLGNAPLDNLPGGTLTVKKTDTAAAFTFFAKDMNAYVQSGFDDITIASLNEIRFMNSLDASLGRRLILDAPVISANDQSVSVRAPWIEVTNAYYPSSRQSDEPGVGTLSLNADWIDISGSIVLSGFDSVSFNAGHDIRLADHYYDETDILLWGGSLETGADMLFNADRLYPTTQSIFSIVTSGDVATRATVADHSHDPVYSAGGILTLEAANILHMGRWYAPMGQLTLTATAENGRLYMDSGSVVSVSGQSPVNYGGFDDEATVWMAIDKNGSSQYPSLEIEAAPATSVVLNAGEVIMRDGATVDIAGGGEMFGYHFLPGTEGSVNPFDGRYVIVPGMSNALPGQAVYLEGNAAIDAGVYTILPESYAFLDGAVIIQDLGATAATNGDASLSAEGYPVCVGQLRVAGTNLVSAPSRYFSVRPATEVQAEGNFTIERMAVGDAGSFSISGTTTILNGTIDAAPLDGFSGGSLAFGSRIITASTTGARLPEGFFYQSALPDELADRLIVDADAISAGDFGSITIGDPASTDQVVIEAGSTLTAAHLTIAAAERILVGEDSLIHANGDTAGSLVLLSPSGTISIADTAALHAVNEIQIDTAHLDLNGALAVDNSTLNLVGPGIRIGADGAFSGTGPELVIDGTLWNKIACIDTLMLSSRSDITFVGDVDLQAAATLILDADRIVLEGDAGGSVTVAASEIHLQNTSLTNEEYIVADDATGTALRTIAFSAEAMSLSLETMADEGAPAGATNDLAVIGAAALEMTATGNLAVAGEGTLSTGGDVGIESAAIVTDLLTTKGSEPDDAAVVTTADVTLVTDSGRIRIDSSGNTAEPTNGYGGRITLQGRRIDHAGLIHSPSGTIRLKATGSETDGGVFLTAGARLDASGTSSAAGGTVTLETDRGVIEMAAGASIDVSAGGQGDAGSLSIVAPSGGATIAGDLYGQAGGWAGADFYLDSLRLNDFGSIAGRLTDGGFTGNIALRARQGDISATDSLAASSIAIVADAGSVNVSSALDVSGADGGGDLEIDAGQDLRLEAGSALLANSIGAGNGGRIFLSSTNGTIEFANDAVIELNGHGENADGGSVYVRAPRTDTGLQVALNGEIDGASAVHAEGVAVYDGIDTVRQSGMSDNNGIAYMDDLWTLSADWLDGLDFTYNTDGIDDILAVVPGIEIRSDGGMTVDQAIDLSVYTADASSGVLTLRSAGDLTVNKSITDIRTPVAALREKTAVNSWGLNLVAGADMESSDILAVNSSSALDRGRLTTGNGVLIYSEKAPIRFASAENIELNTSGLLSGSNNPMTRTQMAYNIGTFSGSVTGRIGGDLIIRDGGVQTATGDIRLMIDGDLNLAAGNKSGSIRTLGEAPETSSFGDPLREFWAYGNGGGITVDVGGNIDAKPLITDVWDTSSINLAYYHADYNNGGSKGIVTMAGGDVTIQAAGDITCTTGVFGAGNIDVIAGKDLNGRFLVSAGEARLIALDNFGFLEGFENQHIEAFDARIEMTAQGSIELGTIVNPTIAGSGFSGNSRWNLGYSEPSSVSLQSISGSVTLTGQSRFYSRPEQPGRLTILPATLTIDAAEDILFGNSFYMAPSAYGNLALNAGGDIRSTNGNRYTLIMSDADPSVVYGIQPYDVTQGPYATITNGYKHAESLLHKADDKPVTILSGGDIKDLRLFVPKFSEVIAGGDIADIYYHSQNVRLEDATVIAAGGDIRFRSGIETTYQAGIEIGGPGSIIVAAGNMIDLGTTDGIRAVGNNWNPYLPKPDEANEDPPVSLAVFSGLETGSADMLGKLNNTVSFFADLREQGQAYSEAQAQGDPAAAAEILEQINQEVIAPFFTDTELGRGDIDMVNSQIHTSSNAGDIYIVAAGEINVGKSSFRPSGDGGNNSGIYTEAGGDINVYVDGDLNVNESRLMTFFGGNITAWSQNGNVNAGRGSKTAISTPEIEVDTTSDPPTITFKPPAVGSGVRALTFDPDGTSGPDTEPDIGDVYLFAPSGEIDAGEAGIAGKNVILAATKVVNVQNIEVSGTSVGVPDTSLAATSLGALAGSGTVTEASNVAAEQAGLKGAQERFSKYVADLTENLVPKWIAVEVVGFGEATDAPAADAPTDDVDKGN
jgi:filamentous hemagglutinin